MKFKYKKFSKDLYRPVIPIKVLNKEKFINYEVLVDSGADICLFHSEVGTYLGIDVESGIRKVVTGVGGKVSQYFVHKINIEVGGWSYEIEVGFIPNIGNSFVNYGLVGQIGFFEYFQVIFDFSKEDIELKRKIS
jgi:hypothetical protein